MDEGEKAGYSSSYFIRSQWWGGGSLCTEDVRWRRVSPIREQMDEWVKLRVLHRSLEFKSHVKSIVGLLFSALYPCFLLLIRTHRAMLINSSVIQLQCHIDQKSYSKGSWCISGHCISCKHTPAQTSPTGVCNILYNNHHLLGQRGQHSIEEEEKKHDIRGSVHEWDGLDDVFQVIFHPYQSADKEDASSVCFTSTQVAPAKSKVHVQQLAEWMSKQSRSTSAWMAPLLGRALLLSCSRTNRRSLPLKGLARHTATYHPDRW